MEKQLTINNRQIPITNTQSLIYNLESKIRLGAVACGSRQRLVREGNPSAALHRKI
ncbi:hypothetical protein LC612_20435 [Nostoc sp. CHAB 5834]|nr:hypothetical protein [Nostoc sp. CHAB 5834]